MGTCWNCGKQITLSEEEIKCDSCGKVVNYQCNYCHEWFSIYDEQKKEKIKECGVCGFFVCPNCGTCSPDCEKDIWQTKINKILAPEITYSNIPNLQKKVNALLELIENIKISHEKRECPKGVPITYAKGRIKTCAARMLGYRTKSDSDLLKFNQRMSEILDIPNGVQLTINVSREDGSYGQEYRDVFNMCICMGHLKKQKVKKDFDGEEKEIEIYKRIDNGFCQKFDNKNLVFKICPKCKKEYPLDSPQEYCGCHTYTKGKKIGESPRLRLKLSNKDICQMNRGSFIKSGESKSN